MRYQTKVAMCIAAVCLLWAVNPTPAAAQSTLRDLQCDKAANPRGVESPHPQLSWVINSNVIQRAYQVLVASSEEKLKSDEGDLWDSGKVRSDQKSVPYRGKPLVSFQRCYWKVRIWGTLYTAVEYGEPASWEMGVLLFENRKAK